MNHSKFLGYCTGRRFELYLEGDVLGKFVIKVGEEMAYYCALDFWDVVVLEIIVVNGYALWRSGDTRVASIVALGVQARVDI